MPTYDYRCPANGRVLEVFHGMNERVENWGALCALAGIEAGDTDLQAPVERLANGGQIVRNTSLGDKTPPCQSGAPCCGRSGCDLG